MIIGTGSGRDAPGFGAFEPFIGRLARLTALDREELAALEGLFEPPRQVKTDREIVSPGAAVRHLHVLLEGWAARTKLMPDGRRQFSALLLPGDACDIDALEIPQINFGVIALEPCTVACIPHDALLALAATRPQVARTLTWLACVENVVMSEWIAWHGRLTAVERLANLFCELQARLEMVGRAEPDGGFRLPLTQDELADAVGLTSVHVNRTLKEMRERGLAEVRGQRVLIPDLDALRRAGGFSPRYLQITARAREAA